MTGEFVTRFDARMFVLKCTVSCFQQCYSFVFIKKESPMSHMCLTNQTQTPCHSFNY